MEEQIQRFVLWGIHYDLLVRHEYGGRLIFALPFHADQSQFPKSSHSPIPPTYLEQKRAEAQRQYKEEQAYIAAHKADFDKALEEERQAMAKEMSGSLLGLLDTVAGKKPQDLQSSTKTGAGDGEGRATP